MKQSNNKKSRDVTAFLYERLSRDDNLEGESYSIGNQKEMLTRYVREQGWNLVSTYVDDGVSGTTFAGVRSVSYTHLPNGCRIIIWMDVYEVVFKKIAIKIQCDLAFCVI